MLQSSPKRKKVLMKQFCCRIFLSYILPAVMGVGLRWRNRKLGHRALVGCWVGVSSRWGKFCCCLAGLGGCSARLGLRAVLLSHGALLLWCRRWWRVAELCDPEGRPSERKYSKKSTLHHYFSHLGLNSENVAPFLLFTLLYCVLSLQVVQLFAKNRSREIEWCQTGL